MMTNILMGLFPAVMWGILPIILSKIGGQPIHQMIGTTFGALIFAIVITLFTFNASSYSWFIIVICFLSGIFWSVGQLNQYRAFAIIGVSKTMPLSTGLNLIGNSLFGVTVFGEWQTTTKLILGFSAIILIIIGVFLTSYQETVSSKGQQKLRQGVIILLISAVGYLGYATLPRFTDADGWTAFLPQVCGMVIGALGLAIFEEKETKIFANESWLNLFSGVIFSLGALGYLISLQLNGVATGYTLSQMGVLISTIGGILFLHEKKTHKEMSLVIIGLLLVTASGILMGLTKM